MIDRRSAVLGLLSLGASAAGGCAPGPAIAEAPARAPAPGPRPPVALAWEGRALKARLGPSGPSGWLVADLDSGAVLDGHDPERRFAPASVAKLPTALYALDRLGAGYRFETAVRATGPVSDGVLQGDLVLIGSGDPELDSDALAALAARVAARVRRVEGRFLVVSARLPEHPVIDPEQPEDVAYNPGVGGLNLNFNRVRLRWRRGASSATFSALGDDREAPVGCIGLEVGGTGPAAHRVVDGCERWRLSSAALRGRGARWLPVKRPGLYAGEAFRSLAAEAGLALPAPERRDAVPAATHLLAERRGRPLAMVLADMLRFSTNLTAEAVGLAATHAQATAATGLPGSLLGSAALMNAWIAQRTGHAPGDPRIGFANHSGLTTRSRVSPSRMVALLQAAAIPDGEAADPAATLAMILAGDPPVPAGATPGTAPLASGPAAAAAVPGPAAALLPDNPTGTPAPGALVHAKTGTMDYVRGLSGYLVTPGGRRLAFAVFSNDLARRRGGVHRIDRVWMARARAFERAMLTLWAERLDG